MIKVHNLTKYFGKVKAVDNLSFTISKGTIWGFVGPNGSGKTTTLRMLATLLMPNEGSAQIAGFDILQKPYEVRSRIGFMPDFFGVYDTLKVWEYLAFYASAYGLENTVTEKRSNELLELVELAHKKHDYVDALSRGMKQRLGLARALIHDPQVLLLDEPASGLDPRARVELREILKKLKTLGKTVIISSHILPELAEMCNQVGIMQEGRLLAVGSVEEIMQKSNFSAQIILRVLSKEDVADAVEVIKGLGVFEMHVQEFSISFNGSSEPARMVEILNKLIAAGVQVVEFKESAHNLEDVFLKITKEVD